MEKRVGIIGHFAEGKNVLDGQTIKTKILCGELEKVTQWRIRKVDTYDRAHAPLRLAWNTVTALLTCKDIFVLLSGNGMRFYFPILSVCAKLFGTRVYHSVIGGNLDRYVVKYPKFRKYLNRFQVNWVETQNLKNALETVGVTNAEVMPNFKRLNVAREEDQPRQWDMPFRFCTFSRVMKEKGIEDAMAAVQSINEKAGKSVCMLDIYGRIDEGYQARFEELMGAAPGEIRYCGQVPYDQSVEAIKTYYALLFPTFWKGEGFAGTIVDAFSAGVPVIATDWNCNAEIISQGENGILYPSDRFQTLEEAVRWAVENPEALCRMRAACLQAAQGYQPDAYIAKIIDRVEAAR